MKFPINRELLSSVKGANGRYVVDVEPERKLREKDEREKKKAGKEKEENSEKNDSLAKLEKELNQHETNLKVAEESIKVGNQKLQEALSEKSVSRAKIQSAQAMIDMRLEQKHKLNNVIKEITKKKKEL